MLKQRHVLVINPDRAVPIEISYCHYHLLHCPSIGLLEDLFAFINSFSGLTIGY